MIRIYTDGANSSNGKPWSHGGCGWIIIWDGVELEGGKSYEPDIDLPVTNNKMELNAIIHSLESLDDLKVSDQKIIVRSDSQICVNGATGKWRRRKNLDLWNNLNQIMYRLKKRKNSVNFEWVKGHNGDYYNERVDRLAVKYKDLAKPSAQVLKELKESSSLATL